MAGRGKVDDVWIDVPSKNRKERNGGKLSDKNVTKYFVSNLPFGCTPWEVSDFLGFYGEVAGTYIARKNDKNGNRFGFVSFKNVKDAKDLEHRMNGIKMGKFILKVNIARFAVENAGLLEEFVLPKSKSGYDSGRVEHHPPEYQQQNQKVGNVSSMQKGGLSFADLFSGRNNELGDTSGTKDFTTDKLIHIPEEVKAFHFLHGSALIGRSVDLNTLTKMDKILLEEGYSGVEIHYVGGISLLLKFKAHEEAVDFLMKQDKWRKWFSVLDMWEGQSLPFERVAWLNLFGVPLHLADNSVFNDIARQFGSIVHPAQLSVDDGDLSTVCVGVLLGDGIVIKDKVMIKWKNRSYQVWVTECSGLWVPDCMGVVGLKEVDSAEDSSPLSSEFSPAGDNHSPDIEKSLEGEALLHGDSNLFSASRSMDVGPEVSITQERETGACMFPAANKSKKLKRRSKIRSPASIRPNCNLSSPADLERAKKRPRPSSSDPFDLDRFINNWKSLSEASNKAQGWHFDIGCLVG
ncbi:putative RNA recognition motif domain, nucleotide-binding alpha-beta plait domain superfamily [Helianthus annuus]|nr:putative RNA recognition motif domain, nucleotide-binding alpha-beta plait domain superfamily [Helianthus annuus]